MTLSHTERSLPEWALTAFGPIGGHVHVEVKSDPDYPYAGTLRNIALEGDTCTRGWLVLDQEADGNAPARTVAIALDDVSAIARHDDAEPEAEPAPDDEGWGEETVAAALPIHMGRRIRVHNPTTGETTEGELVSVAPNPSSMGGQRVVIGMDGGANHTYMLADDVVVRVA